MQDTAFADLTFQGQLRPSQADVVRLVTEQLSDQRTWHIVAPPGSGKTVLGLYLWAHHVQRPAVVLSPNSAIQSQWARRVDLFTPAAASSDLVSTSPRRTGLLTSLTYQSISLPSGASASGDLAATSLWVQRLLESGHAESEEAANAWISDLRHRSPDYFRERLASWRKQVRQQSAAQGNTGDFLHQSAQDTIARLAAADVGLMILDECHHLMGHWGHAVEALTAALNDPIVLGLTATPPDEGHRRKEVQRYHQLLGDIDYEVPVPAVVRDGYLAPYQDLAWFVRPTERELAFVADADRHFRTLLHELCEPRAAAGAAASVLPLPEWVADVLQHRRLPTRQVDTWKQYHQADSDFADAGRALLHGLQRPLPTGVPRLHSFLHRWRRHQDIADLPLDTLTVVLDRYIRHGLRRSADAADQALCEQAIDRMRMLGVQITEVGHQRCASPISRILGYTQSKVEALVPILECELEQLDEDLRAVVISDFEKSSAVAADVNHVLDEEAGGAVAAFRRLIENPTTNTLDPILMTGSTILVDHDLSRLFEVACQHWLTEHNFQVELTLHGEGSFFVVSGKGRDWCPRVYIQMVTHLFQEGITRCLIGTRGLLGEGWDANRINVLIDLTTVTTSMTVNQLRGRSIRLDPQQPNKVANNWDIICMAPEFAGGLDDYRRLCRKHDRIYGVTDDGAIEKGIGHVHAALTDIHAGDQEHDFQLLNHDMLSRASRRDVARELWKVGEDHIGQAVRSVEFRPWQAAFPDVAWSSVDGVRMQWTAETLALAMGRAVVEALRNADLLKGHATVRHTVRDGGYVSLFPENCEPDDAERIADCMAELLSPFEKARYIVPLNVGTPAPTRSSRWLPKRLGRLLESLQPATLCWFQLPSPLAKTRELGDLFQASWNDHVSVGDVVFCHKGEGRDTLADIVQAGRLPHSPPHVRDCFL